MNTQQIYEELTEKIIQAVESADEKNWKMPWQILGTSGLARNIATKKPYQGINSLVLGLKTEREGYSANLWATFNQIGKLGGTVKKGEKSTTAIFFKPSSFKTKDKNGDEVTRSFPLCRVFRVFNISQTNLELPKPENKSFDAIEDCENVVAGYIARQKLAVNYGGDSAYYSPKEDKVQLPLKEQFKTPEFFYSVAFHELTHSTGHKSRLNRDGIEKLAPFGSELYSQEELVAEIGASFLCAHLNIENEAIENTSAAYLKGWMSKIKNDPQALPKAAAKAQRAVNMILGEK